MYFVLVNIPRTFHSVHLRNYFSCFTDKEAFEYFHYLHRDTRYLLKCLQKNKEHLSTLSKNIAENETQLNITENEMQLNITENETQSNIAENETQLNITENEMQLNITENETQLNIAENETHLNIADNATQLNIAENETQVGSEILKCGNQTNRESVADIVNYLSGAKLTCNDLKNNNDSIVSASAVYEVSNNDIDVLVETEYKSPNICPLVDENVNRCNTNTGTSNVSTHQNQKCTRKSDRFSLLSVKPEFAEAFKAAYHGKFWTELDGTLIPTRCLLFNIDPLVKACKDCEMELPVSTSKRRPTLVLFSKMKEMPEFVVRPETPYGNVGTPLSFFLSQHRLGKLDNKLAVKLGLELSLWRPDSRIPVEVHITDEAIQRQWNELSSEECMFTSKGDFIPRYIDIVLTIAFNTMEAPPTTLADTGNSGNGFAGKNPEDGKHPATSIQMGDANETEHLTETATSMEKSSKMEHLTETATSNEKSSKMEHLTERATSNENSSKMEHLTERATSNEKSSNMEEEGKMKFKFDTDLADVEKEDANNVERLIATALGIENLSKGPFKLNIELMYSKRTGPMFYENGRFWTMKLTEEQILNSSQINRAPATTYQHSSDRNKQGAMCSAVTRGKKNKANRNVKSTTNVNEGQQDRYRKIKLICRRTSSSEYRELMEAREQYNMMLYNIYLSGFVNEQQARLNLIAELSSMGTLYSLIEEYQVRITMFNVAKDLFLKMSSTNIGKLKLQIQCGTLQHQDKKITLASKGTVVQAVAILNPAHTGAIMNVGDTVGASLIKFAKKQRKHLQREQKNNRKRSKALEAREQRQSTFEAPHETAGYDVPCDFKDHTQGFGRKLLESMGWREGEGLGKRRHGIAQPLVVTSTRSGTDKKGIGFFGLPKNHKTKKGAGASSSEKEGYVCNALSQGDLTMKNLSSSDKAERDPSDQKSEYKSVYTHPVPFQGSVVSLADDGCDVVMEDEYELQ